MNCWKSVNIAKEFGYNRIFLISFLIGLLTFIILYVPISILHGASQVKESGFLPFAMALLLLPTIHSLTHILPLIMMNKRIKIICKKKRWITPVFNYNTRYHLTKKTSLIVALAPTIFITVPGIVASYIFKDFYVYFLLFTAVHIGISFMDILYVSHILKAPKKAFIENRNDEFDILIKAHQ